MFELKTGTVMHGSKLPHETTNLKSIGLKRAGTWARTAENSLAPGDADPEDLRSATGTVLGARRG